MSEISATGDDVGMVLSPQCFHNLNLHSDIFNHSNVHFWEYMQPGYDTLGFISCTGKSVFTYTSCISPFLGPSPTSPPLPPTSLHFASIQYFLHFLCLTYTPTPLSAWSIQIQCHQNEQL